MRIRCQCPACGVSLMLENTPDRTVKCPKCFHNAPLADYKEKPAKNIYCPNCDASIMLKSDKILKTITCPKCKRTELFFRYTDSPRDKDSSSVEETETTTKLKGSLSDSGAMYRPGKLVVKNDSNYWLGNPDPDAPAEVFTLKCGENTLGRQSPKSSASIQFPTTDSYMSKSHAKIEVLMKPDATFEHCLSDIGSMNGTFHNEQKLEQGDVSILIPGDKIRMGRTTFIFMAE